MKSLKFLILITDKMTENLLEDVQKCMADPVSNVIQNFSLDKSEEHYNKWVVQWSMWDYKFNPAAKKEEEYVYYDSLLDLPAKASEAHNLCVNLRMKEFNKGVERHICDKYIVIMRYRLKTFNEWLHDWLSHALSHAYMEPEHGARMILARELWEGVYTNTMIHCFCDGQINAETLKRLWHYEKCNGIVKRVMEEDIEQAMKALEDIEESNEEGEEKSEKCVKDIEKDIEKCVEVLQLKI